MATVLTKEQVDEHLSAVCGFKDDLNAVKESHEALRQERDQARRAVCGLAGKKSAPGMFHDPYALDQHATTAEKREIAVGFYGEEEANRLFPPEAKS